MSENEEKPMLITDDLLEQVLRNDITKLQAMGRMGFCGWIPDKDAMKRLAETEALLERLK